MSSNRHPVDELGDVRQNIKLLQEREQQLRTMIIAGECGKVGEENAATVKVVSRRSICIADVEDAFGMEATSQIIKTNDTNVVSVTKLDRT